MAKKPAKKTRAKPKTGSKKSKPSSKKSSTKPAKKSPTHPAKKAKPLITIARTAESDVWRAKLRAELAKTGPSFSAYLRGLGATGWEHADSPELAGLEKWGTDLASRDLALGVAALVAAAEYGFPHVIAAGGKGNEEFYRANRSDPDDASVETQLARCAAWLDAPTEANTERVDAAYDNSAQSQAWDEDRLPSDEIAFYWYLDIGQCCCAAITVLGDDPNRDSYHYWPPATSIGRGLVVAARGLRIKKKSMTKTSAQVVDELRAGMAS